VLARVGLPVWAVVRSCNSGDSGQATRIRRVGPILPEACQAGCLLAATFKYGAHHSLCSPICAPLESRALCNPWAAPGLRRASLSSSAWVARRLQPAQRPRPAARAGGARSCRAEGAPGRCSAHATSAAARSAREAPRITHSSISAVGPWFAQSAYARMLVTIVMTGSWGWSRCRPRSRPAASARAGRRARAGCARGLRLCAGAQPHDCGVRRHRVARAP